MKVCSRVKLRDNRRLGVFLQIHFKLVYHMISFDLEMVGWVERGEERREVREGSAERERGEREREREMGETD